MDLREISSALQRGEALTVRGETTAIVALLGLQEPASYVGRGDAGGDELRIVYVRNGNRAERRFDPWPSRSVDAALAFVAEVFADRKRVYFRIESTVYSSWNATIATNPTKAFDVFGVANAPTPAAAIMAAAIEAHLSKGENE